MRMDQRMKLAPRMIQSMEILQLPLAALEERIEQELASNPTLELREPGADRETIEKELEQERRDAREGERELVVKDDSDDRNHADDFERLANVSEEYGESWSDNTYETGGDYGNYGSRVVRSNGERDVKMDAMANTAARGPSLTDQLLDQWHLVECDDDVRDAGEYLIGFIDNDGYLRTDRDTLVQQSPPSMQPQRLDEALTLIKMTMEPVGIGASDVRECLLLQIDALESLPSSPDLSLERTLVDQYLKDIEANRLPRIAKELDCTVEQINEAKANLRQFHPRPGRMLVEDSPQTITPDAIIEYDEEGDRYVARLTNDRIPTLQLNRRYVRMMRDQAVDKKTKNFVGTNLRNGRWLMDAIVQRQNTLLRVINVVIEAQRDFFEQGEQALKPLPMTTVADQLGIHVATVSRAVSEKYLQTPRGIFPLRMFFSGGTETEAGDSMSWTAVQAKLKHIIDEEDKSSPLSDDALVEELTKHGIEIARRTVAKYRKQLNIPTARQRKQY